MISRKQYKIGKNPWITKGILKSIKHKNKLYTKYLKSKSQNILLTYKKYRNKLTHIKEMSKHNHYEGLFKTASNSSETWKHINHLLRKNKPKPSLPQTIINEGKKMFLPKTSVMR